MKRSENSTFFYESKWIVGIYLFSITEVIIALLWGLTLACPGGKIQLLLQEAMLIGPLLLFAIKIKSISMPIIKINAKKISFNGQTFQWDEVTQVCLEKGNNRKSLVPQLKLEWGKIPYFIQLKYMGDRERRLLLDEIEKHKPVRYIECCYEKNYATWNMGFMIFILMVIQIGLACAVMMAIMQ